MTGWLSTCSVALPPLRVNRTTWYLPSLTITALSSMIMSSVPTLKITPIFPRSCRQRMMENTVRKIHSNKIKVHFEQGSSFAYWHLREKIFISIFCTSYHIKPGWNLFCRNWHHIMGMLTKKTKQTSKSLCVHMRMDNTNATDLSTNSALQSSSCLCCMVIHMISFVFSCPVAKISIYFHWELKKAVSVLALWW